MGEQPMSEKARRVGAAFNIMAAEAVEHETRARVTVRFTRFGKRSGLTTTVIKPAGQTVAAAVARIVEDLAYGQEMHVRVTAPGATDRHVYVTTEGIVRGGMGQINYGHGPVWVEPLGDDEEGAPGVQG